ncbi:DUF3352 domain-containing protein [Candidatus Peregrinibacteria bacterium]|nr:DUF3352 domain-containing protein [Candidatus Peregrinibacteria bacterium]MBT4148654.1 DUF3352 domain-containing protein [Candidatus Peregrinibacteria bacterium]MBT4366340.1 DUF3352 domain-containing protein [Candidatus Peregrinibacteria bacterium]MBT4456015.1 DUF3352 domain-containing protein [Candidatus Peregrinibacteria bacterium]
MGRKSSAKKKRRLEEKIKEEKKTPKSKKKKATAKATAKAAKKAVKVKIQVPRQKIFGGLLSAILFTMLVYVSIELFTTAFRPTSIAEYLPADKTSAMLEINTNVDHTQLVKAKELLAQTSYSAEVSFAKIEERMSLDLEKDIQPWLGRQIGVAEIAIEEDGSPKTVYFLETMGREQTKTSLANVAENNLTEISEKTYNNEKIYEFNLRYPGEDRSLDNMAYASFVDKYLIFSIGSEEVIHLILDAQTNTTQTKLAEKEKFQDALDESAINRVAFVFINFDQHPEALLQKYGVFSGSSLLNSAIDPFSKIFSSEGLVVIAADKYFEIETFMSLEEDFLKGNRYVTYQADYDAELMKYIPEEINVFWGGEDVERQVKRIATLLSEGNEETTQLFEGVFESYTEKYFGNNVSLIEDIYPILQNEFALAQNAEGKYLISLELEDPTEDALRIQKIANNFISAGAVFEPHIEEHELPDGTIAQEIVATPEELIKSETKYDDLTIYQMETESKEWGVYYSILDSILLASTNKEFLEKSLDLYLNKSDANLAISKIPNSDEVFHFNILSFWPESKLVKSLSTGKEYFGNGVKAYYYIYVE